MDEIHKYKKWENLIKGEDSLQGRYHCYRLHPFSLAEIAGRKNEIKIFQEIVIDSKNTTSELELLERFGGFPESLIKQNIRLLRRLHNEKTDRLFREDIRDVETIRDIGSMKLLGDLLPAKVGSLLSINSLREDLDVSHRAVTRWLNILESFYYHFRIYPYKGKNIRSIKKEPKLYLWDWSEVTDEAARFENLIASHLLKLVHFLYDYEGYKAGLYFLRNADKKEVDFLITVDEKPWFAVEVKLNDKNVSSSLRYFKDRLEIPHIYQVIKKKDVDRLFNQIRVVSADKFLPGLI